MTRDERRVIIASSVGTILEWYDFFLYGALAMILGIKFFGQFDDTIRSIFAQLTIYVGLLVRPFGALVWGRFGDLVGRKPAFFATVVIVGASTLIVGLLPTSDKIGIAAPIILVGSRILQSLAISGGFGGAAIYVAEHAPPGRRGFYVGCIPASITLGLLLALAVVMITQSMLDDTQFRLWGWRIPLLASAPLLVVSLLLRLGLEESPAFLKMKAEGRQSRAPLREALGRWSNIRLGLIALFGMSAATAVLGSVGTFYILAFLTISLKVDSYSANLLVVTATIVGVAGCVFFAWWSDRVGRKPIILAGCAIAVVASLSIFHILAELANPALDHAQRTISVSVNADPATCSFQFNPAGTARFTSPCDVAKATLTRLSVTYANVSLPAGAPTTVTIGQETISVDSAFTNKLAARVKAAGYPTVGDPSILRLSSVGDLLQGRALQVVGLLVVLVLLGQMVQGPAAAGIVELFPISIRYTAMSLPYQIAAGWIGGLMSAMTSAMNIAGGNMFFSLWYPVAFAAGALVVGLLLLPETRDRDIAA
ncbi:MFS transporter [Bradyrhizobium sp. 2TAF24]|uniref:MFS transporter n=1 Tax=Bradyrhizobium sp. 2TAF24 TaxID=3233011 RepID=UPI003F91812A